MKIANMDRITLKDIARELDLSPATVSKALNGKTCINANTRELVAQTAQKIGYSINKQAQSLSRKPVNVAIVMPNIWKEFFGYIRYGMEIELDALYDSKIHGKFYCVSDKKKDRCYRKKLTSFLDDGTDAVIICPGGTNDYVDCIDALYDKNIKTVIVLRNALKGGRCFAEIKIAAEIGGGMAADYANLLCPKDASAAVFIGNKDTEDHRIKAENFQRVADRKGFSVSGVYETQDDVDIAYMLTKKLLAEQPELKVIYVATSNSVAVCRCILDMGEGDRVKVIATDIFPDMIPFIESELISATLYQNPIRMGRMAVKTIYNAFSTGERPDADILVYPQLVLKSNYGIFADYLKKAESSIGLG